MAKRKPAPPAEEPEEPQLPGLAHITADLQPLAVRCNQTDEGCRLRLDPHNARAHDAANIAAIKTSLQKFGQRTPLVAHRESGIVEKGNGTLIAARELGWEWIAVVWVDDDQATQVGYAIADNRTAELAQWDADVLALQLVQVQQTDSALYDALLLAEIAPAPPEPEKPPVSVPVPEVWQVVAECKGEAEQKLLYERLKREGFEVKVVTM